VYNEDSIYKYISDIITTVKLINKHIYVLTFARKSCYSENEQRDFHMLDKRKGTALVDRTNPTLGWHTFQEQFRDRNYSHVEHKE